MPNYNINFNDQDDYSYSTSEINISGGIAKLKEDLSDIYARWTLNETSGNDTFDSSDNGYSGTFLGTPTRTTGKLNNCIYFDDPEQAINFQNIGNYDIYDDFSIEFWTKFDSDVTDKTYFISKNEFYTNPGYSIFRDNNSAIVFQIANGSENRFYVKTGEINDQDWHHVICSYSGSVDINDVHIFLDSVDTNLTVVKNNLTSSIANTSNFVIGSNDDNNTVSGYIDNVIVYDKFVSGEEVFERYNEGNGKETFDYLTTNPSVYNISGTTGDNIYSFQTFTVTDNSEDLLGYQISDNSTDWKYWNGSIWETVSGVVYNSDTTINDNIDEFSPISGSIFVKTIFVSDGSTSPSVDNIQVGYISGSSPNIYAGTDKSTFNGMTISPFSDASFSDPDGIITTSEYRVSGEVEAWTDIPQGGYGSLLEAVQNFDYHYCCNGEIITALKVTDNDNLSSEDSLIVSVGKYTTTFNVLDNETGYHISGLTFTAGSGILPVSVTSPFTYEYNQGDYYTQIEKSSYGTITSNISVSDEIAYNYYMSKYITIADIGLIANAVWDEQKSEHTDSGTFGEHVNNLSSTGGSTVSGSIENFNTEPF